MTTKFEMSKMEWSTKEELFLKTKRLWHHREVRPRDEEEGEMKEGTDGSESSLSPCDFIPELMSFVSLDLYIRWEQSWCSDPFISCLYLYASLYTLRTQTVYFDRFNVKCFVFVGFFTFTRAGVCLLTAVGFGGFFGLFGFFKLNEKIVFWFLQPAET